MEQIFGFQEPFLHLYVSNKEEVSMMQFSFNNTANFVTKTIECKKCKTIENLFAEFASAFMFPEYFGNNWAALDECINDLDWLQYEAYLLILYNAEDLLSLEQDNFKTFVKVLLNSSHEWVRGRNYDSFPTSPTPFHIIFHCSYGTEDALLSQLRDSGINKVEILHL